LEAVLRSSFGREQLETYYAATRQHLVARRVAPLEELAEAGHAAAQGLVAALWMATERENIREMRECSTAILAHLGMGPVKRSHATHEHSLGAVGRVSDPVILAEIVRTGEIPAALLEPPSPVRH
jgi:hypothetical protein